MAALALSAAPEPPLMTRAFEAILPEFGFRGAARAKTEALPYFASIGDVETLRACLLRLGFETDLVRTRVKNADLHGPALFLIGEDQAFIRTADGGFRNLEGEPITPPAQAIATIISLAPQEEAQINPDRRPWTTRQFDHLKPAFFGLLLTSLLINLLALAAPLFSMAVYEHVIRPESYATLLWLLPAVAGALALEMALRTNRADMLARAGSRFDAALLSAIFAKLMELPLRMTASAPISQQLARLKEFENIRAIFTTHAASAFLDIPFAVLIMLGLLILEPAIGMVPIALAALYILLAFIVVPALGKLSRASAQQQTLLQALVREGVVKENSIRQLGLADLWLNRVRAQSRAASAAKLRVQFWENLVHTMVQSLTSVAGIAALGVGAVLVMAGQMQLGALVASMLVIWRVLQPIQTAFMSVQRLLLFKVARQQADALLALPGERPAVKRFGPMRALRGAVSIEGLAFRYPNSVDLALRNVSLSLKPGDCLGVCGPTGAGKTTLLRVLLGLHEPVAGAVYFDGVNLRQIDLAEHRASLAYAGPDPMVLRGTLRENLRLIVPTASDEDLLAALARAGIRACEPDLPEGLDTPLRRPERAPLSPALVAKLQLAAVYARNSMVQLLDDPGALLDQEGDQALIAELRASAGVRTTILISNRPSHLMACQRVVRLERGTITHDGAPQQIVPLVLANASSPERSKP